MWVWLVLRCPFKYLFKFVRVTIFYQLAAAEAEAEALRKELAARRASKDVDLAKLKPAMPEKRIDGTGFRETLFSGPGKASGKL